MQGYSRIVAVGKGLVIYLSVGVVTSCGGGENASSSTPVSPSTACVYAAEPLTFTFYRAGGTGQFTITTASSCGWYAEELASSEDWISVNQSNATIYGNGTKTFTVSPGDIPVSYPAPRNGEIRVRKVETHESLLTISIAQVDPLLGTWSGTVAACPHPISGETCIATEPRLFTVTFDSSTDSSPYSYSWTDITTGTRYSGGSRNWESTETGSSWRGAASGVHDGENRFDFRVNFGDGYRFLFGDIDGQNDISGTTYFNSPSYPVHDFEMSRTALP